MMLWKHDTIKRQTFGPLYVSGMHQLDAGQAEGFSAMVWGGGA